MAKLNKIEFEAVVRKKKTVADHFSATVTTRKMIPFIGNKVRVTIEKI